MKLHEMARAKLSASQNENLADAGIRRIRHSDWLGWFHVNTTDGGYVARKIGWNNIRPRFVTMTGDLVDELDPVANRAVVKDLDVLQMVVDAIWPTLGEKARGWLPKRPPTVGTAYAMRGIDGGLHMPIAASVEDGRGVFYLAEAPDGGLREFDDYIHEGELDVELPHFRVIRRVADAERAAVGSIIEAHGLNEE